MIRQNVANVLVPAVLFLAGVVIGQQSLVGEPVPTFIWGVIAVAAFLAQAGYNIWSDRIVRKSLPNSD